MNLNIINKNIDFLHLEKNQLKNDHALNINNQTFSTFQTFHLKHSYLARNRKILNLKVDFK